VSVVSPEGSLTLPSGRALVSYFSVVYPPLLWSVTDYTPAFPAAAARQTLNSLFAVLVGVAEINPSIHTGVRVGLQEHQRRRGTARVAPYSPNGVEEEFSERFGVASRNRSQQIHATGVAKVLPIGDKTPV
jgi:hypothetical protein